MRVTGLLAVVLTAALTVGCGTITRGTTESVVIKAEPEDSPIRTSMGQYCPRSPCTSEVKRKEDFTAFAEHPGYKPGSIDIKTKVSGGGAAGLAGNVLLGGVIGIGVDAATGSSLDHYPNPAIIKLEPVGTALPETKPTIPRKRDPKTGKPMV